MILKDGENDLLLLFAVYKGEKLLILGFESHLVHSHQQGWFSSVKITRPQAACFPAEKKESLCWNCFYSDLNIRVLLLCGDHAERQGIFIFWHLQPWGNLPSRKLSKRYYLRSSHMSGVYPSGMRIWTPWALCSLGHYSFKCGLLWMQTGSQVDTVSN